MTRQKKAVPPTGNGPTDASVNSVAQSVPDVQERPTTRTQLAQEAIENDTTRTRGWTGLIYPESCVENWQEILTESHIEILVSPLHDKDTNGSTGEIKKAHRHIMLLYQSVKTRAQAQKVFDSIGGTNCQPIQSIRGEARYLCHLDNPEKYQYPVEDVIEINGADYREIICLPGDKYKTIREIIAFIEANNILAFDRLVLWTSENNEDWFRALCDNCSYIIKSYLKSRAWRIESKIDNVIDNWKPGQDRTPSRRPKE